jgi:hypothetical protein
MYSLGVTLAELILGHKSDYLEAIREGRANRGQFTVDEQKMLDEAINELDGKLQGRPAHPAIMSVMRGVLKL